MSYEFHLLVLPKMQMVQQFLSEGLKFDEAERKAEKIIRETPDVCQLCGYQLDSMGECPIHG